jgi:hypothetical protein
VATSLREAGILVSDSVWWIIVVTKALIERFLIAVDFLPRQFRRQRARG